MRTSRTAFHVQMLHEKSTMKKVHLIPATSLLEFIYIEI